MFFSLWIDEIVVTRGGIKYELELSQLIDAEIFWGGWEKWTIQRIEELVKPGYTVLEFGANVGAHTLRMASLVGTRGRVIAVDPSEYGTSKLTRNINLNPILRERITVLQALGSDEGGTIAKGVVRSKWALRRSEPAVREKVSQVPTISVDFLLECYEAVDIIKIDTDGYELHILRGARKTLSTARPTIILELCPSALRDAGTSLGELLQLFSDYRYFGFAEKGFEFPHHSAEYLESEIPPGSSVNAVFCPAVSFP